MEFVVKNQKLFSNNLESAVESSERRMVSCLFGSSEDALQRFFRDVETTVWMQRVDDDVFSGIHRHVVPAFLCIIYVSKQQKQSLCLSAKPPCVSPIALVIHAFHHAAIFSFRHQAT